MSRFVGLPVLFSVLAVMAGCAGQQVQRYDVVVYGGTAGGAVAAIAAAKEGVRVVLLEPRRHVGGMVSGGLGQTDYGNQAVIGGMSREFFERVGEHYRQPVAWHFEPHVAEQVFNDWLKEADVPVLFEHRLSRVEIDGNRIHTIRMETGTSFAAKVFIDATYEGDLMARAGVSYTVGREGRDQYGESLAGVQEHSRFHQFDVAVAGRDENGQLLACVYQGEKGGTGDGDKKIQTYNFRVCLTDQKENQLPLPKPPGYDPRRYEILERYLALRGEDLKMNDVTIFSLMPNGKTDINNRGPFSTDHIGANWDYPEADYKRREEIWQDHVNYVQGFFYFLAHDPCVPKRLRDEINQWGLPKDEFVDTGHWPHQLYVREARRMIGEHVMTQRDVQEDRTKRDSIGMGSFMIDTHHSQRIIRRDGTLENEGDVQVPVRPYEIPYRSLVPKRHECVNLLVPVCMSASHVAYGSLRMEPQYMIMGQASGLAAAAAVRQHVAVQEADLPWLQNRLREQRQVLSMETAVSRYVDPRSLAGVVVDNAAASLTGAWRPSVVVGPFVGADYVTVEGGIGGKQVARFVPDLPAGGRYEVRVAYNAYGNRAPNVAIRINTPEGVRMAVLNQRQVPANPPFVSLGVFRFPAGPEGWVEIDAAGADGYVVADAVQWLPQADH